MRLLWIILINQENNALLHLIAWSTLGESVDWLSKWFQTATDVHQMQIKWVKVWFLPACVVWRNICKTFFNIYRQADSIILEQKPCDCFHTQPWYMFYISINIALTLWNRDDTRVATNFTSNVKRYTKITFKKMIGAFYESSYTKYM